MNKEIRDIINRHCEKISNIDQAQNIAKIVKAMDSITQETYAEIYATRDGRKNGTYQLMESKLGHCC